MISVLRPEIVASTVVLVVNGRLIMIFALNQTGLTRSDELTPSSRVPLGQVYIIVRL